MEFGRVQAGETAAYLKPRMKDRPAIGLVTGTGLGDSAEVFEVEDTIDYQDIPHFPVSTVESHYGRLLIGHKGPHTVMALQGRFHLYEGYTPQAVTFPVRVMQALGVRGLILSNAAGGLNPAFTPGEIMVIKDHINLTGANPLVGPNDDDWGLRFPDMSFAYDPQLAARTTAFAAAEGIAVQKGIYAGLKGPSLETPAEIRYLKTIGADAVGFSTVMEVIAAVHAGIKVIGLSTITNVHTPDDPAPATVEEILAVAREAAPHLQTLTTKIMEQIDV